jgi:hypothetical protein
VFLLPTVATGFVAPMVSLSMIFPAIFFLADILLGRYFLAPAFPLAVFSPSFHYG